MSDDLQLLNGYGPSENNVPLSTDTAGGYIERVICHLGNSEDMMLFHFRGRARIILYRRFLDILHKLQLLLALQKQAILFGLANSLGK